MSAKLKIYTFSILTLIKLHGKLTPDRTWLNYYCICHYYVYTNLNNKLTQTYIIIINYQLNWISGPKLFGKYIKCWLKRPVYRNRG